MCGVSSLGATNAWSQSAAKSAPFVPVKATVVTPFARAHSTALRQLDERPLVVSANRTSPGRACASSWRENTSS
jgi:hypothetical protein